MTEQAELVAAILALGVARGGSQSPADMVRHYQAVREELHLLREAKARQDMEQWNRHAHLEKE